MLWKKVFFLIKILSAIVATGIVLLLLFWFFIYYGAARGMGS